MRTKDIEYLVLISVEDRLTFATGDPAFAWHFVAAFVRAGKVLPDAVWQAALWRAYCCRRYGPELTYQDPVCFKALSLRHPKERVVQRAIKALICAGLTSSQIAEALGISVEVVELYSQLFFNVSDRREDKAFMMKVLNPKAHLKMFNADRAVHNPELLLMNVGYLLGPGVVLEQLGIKSGQEDHRPVAELMRSANLELLRITELKAQLAMLGTGDPGLGMMRAIVAAEAKHQPDAVDEDSRMGLTRLSMDEGAMMVFKRIVVGAAEERRRNARIFDEQKAAEEAKKKIAGGGIGKPA